VWRERRVRTTAGAAVFAVAAVLGSVASAAHAAEGAKEVSYHQFGPLDTDAEVFMAPTATRQQIKAIRHALQSNRKIVRYAYLDHDAAYRVFVQLFWRNNPAALHGIEPSDLPTSFRVRFRPHTEVVLWIQAMLPLPGVDDVTQPGSTARGVDLNEVARLCAGHGLGYELFMRDTATPKQIEAVRMEIDRTPGVALTAFLTKDDAFRDFQETFAGDDGVLARVAPADLQVSFRMHIDAAAFPTVYTDLQSLPAVDRIVSPNGACGTT
jgi:cell division protein FtsX